MKTKGAVFLGVAILMMVLLMLPLGCVTETETTYKEVTVSTMTLSIPTDWQRAEDIEEIVGYQMSAMEPELAQYYQFDAYETPDEDFGFILMVMKVSEMVELVGMTWEGWEAQMKAEYSTKEDYLTVFTAGFITEGAEEVTQTLTRHHTIHDNDAIEGQFKFRMEGEPAKGNVLLVFAENDLGLVMLLGEESPVTECEDIWDTIRDSVQFS